ncbi:MAG: terminase small subunit [Caudoviricetes sp.]|nr:MAG: terminase small subunit [Caudoviricetes sp.]
MLNEAQRKFVEATVRGATPKEAAIAAGLSEKTARNAGARMRKHPNVVAALEAIGFSTPGAPLTFKTPAPQNSQAPEPEPEDDPLDDLPETTDSNTFLEAVLSNPKVPLGRRMEAAKLLQPYQHAKIGEKGKKETKADGAKQASSSGNAYATGRPPLKAVPN